MSKFVKGAKMLISIKEKQSFDIAFVSNCKENVTFTLGYCGTLGYWDLYPERASTLYFKNAAVPRLGQCDDVVSVYFC